MAQLAFVLSLIKSIIVVGLKEWKRCLMVQLFRSFGLALLLSLGMGSLGSTANFLCDKYSEADVDICYDTSKSSPFLLNSLSLVISNLPRIVSLPKNCLSFEYQIITEFNISWVLREIHNSECGGDPNTAPAAAHLETISNDGEKIKLSMMDIPCECTKWLVE